MKITALSTKGGPVCALALALILSAFTSAPAGTIGGTNADWNNWAEVAGLPAARYALAGGVMNDRLYAIGGVGVGTKTNVYQYNGTNWSEVAGLPAPQILFFLLIFRGGVDYTSCKRDWLAPIPSGARPPRAAT